VKGYVQNVCGIDLRSGEGQSLSLSLCYLFWIIFLGLVIYMKIKKGGM
jgi:hypothetical protein